MVLLLIMLKSFQYNGYENKQEPTSLIKTVSLDCQGEVFLLENVKYLKYLLFESVPRIVRKRVISASIVSSAV